MSISLKIVVVNQNNTKTMRFSKSMSVHDACLQIEEKVGEGGRDHGLFQVKTAKQTPRWLKAAKTLQFYDLENEAVLEYKKKHRALKIRLLDDTVKTIMVDDSHRVSDIVGTIAGKMSIYNPEEYSLQYPNPKYDAKKSNLLERPFIWLKSNLSLHEQGVADDTLLTLKKKYFFTDATVDKSDQIQLHLMYVQSRDSILDGSYPTTKGEGIALGALQAQINHGDYQPEKHVVGFLQLLDILPTQWAKNKGIEKEIFKEWKKVVGMSDINAKYRYIQLCRSLKTYGISTFPIRRKEPKGRKKKDYLLGITRESILLMDWETKEVLTTYKITQIKRWAASEKSFTLDMGDYEDDYLNAETNEADSIAALIAGYIDIILTARKPVAIAAEEEGTVIAGEEVIQRQAGRAGVITTSTFNPSGPSNSRGGLQQARQVPSAQIKVVDLNSAINQASLLIDELQEDPAQYTYTTTTMTPQQYKNQLLTHSNAVASAAKDLIHQAKLDATLISKPSMVTSAKSMMSQISQLAESAKFAAAAGDDGDISLIDGAKKLSEAISNLLKTSDAISDNPHDPSLRTNIEDVATNVQHAFSFLTGAAKNQLADQPAVELISQTSYRVGASTSVLANRAIAIAETIDDPEVSKKLLAAAKTIELSGKNLEKTTSVLGATILDPDCQRQFNDTSDVVSTTVAALNEIINMHGDKYGDLEELRVMALTTNDALGSLVTATEVAETKNIGADSSNFAEANINLDKAFIELRSSLGDTQKMSVAFKSIVGNTNKLVSSGKLVAAGADQNTQQRLIDCAKAAAESVGVLMAAVKTATQTPSKENEQAVLEASDRLQGITRGLTNDTGKLASVTGLRSESKHLASATSGLIGVATLASEQLENPEELKAATKLASDTIAALIDSTKRATNNPNDEGQHFSLLEAGQNSAYPAQKLVATTKMIASKINDPNLKQKLLFSADSTAEAIKKLLAASEEFKNIGGHVEIEETLEKISALAADIDLSEMEVNSGNLESDGQTQDGAETLLNMSLKNFEGEIENFKRAIGDPNKTKEALDSLSAAVESVTATSKGFTSTMDSKASQLNLLKAAKQITSASRQYIIATKHADSNDMAKASQSVQAAIASVIAAASNIDTSALDNASDLIEKENEKIGNQGEKIEYDNAVEDLENCSKAVSAAIAQLSGAAQNNPKSVASAAKITAQSIPSLITATNNAIECASDVATKKSIESKANKVNQEIIALLAFSKAKMVSPKDKKIDENISQASQQVSTAISALIKAIGSTGNEECETAIEQIMNHTSFLTSDKPPAPSAVTPHALQNLCEVAKSMAKTTSDMVNVTQNQPDRLGGKAKDAADTIKELVNLSKAVCDGGSLAPEEFSVPASEIRSASAILKMSGGNTPQIIASARTIANATKTLVDQSKQVAQTMTDDPEAQKKLLTATQRLASCTATVAKAAKASAQNLPESDAMISEASQELQESVAELLGAISPGSSLPFEVSEKLTNSSRNVATATSQLINASAASAAKPNDRLLANALSAASAEASVTISTLLKVAGGMSPGVNECEESIENIQKAVAELAQASLAVALDTLDEIQVDHIQAQEELVKSARTIAAGITHLSKASKTSAQAIGDAALEIGGAMEQLCNNVKNAAASAPDKAKQEQIVNDSKDLADSLLGLIMAAQSVGSNPESKENFQEFAEKTKQTSVNIGTLVASLKSDVILVRDLDEAKEIIATSVSDTSPVEGETDYLVSKDEVNTLCKEFAQTVKKLTVVDKTNLVEVGTSAKDMAESVPEIIKAAKLAAQNMDGDEKATQQVFDKIALLGTTTTNLIDSVSKLTQDSKNSAHIVEFGKSFKEVTSSVTELLQAVKHGAVGEIECEKAVDSIAKTASDLEAASLYSAAGALPESDKDFPEARNELIATAKAMAVNSTKLVGSTKGSQDDLGNAAQAISESTFTMAERAKEVASLINDTETQQELLSCAKTISIAAQQLVHAGKDAQKNKGQKQAAETLGKTTQTIVNTIGQLMSTVQAASKEAARGEEALKECGEFIQRASENIDDYEKSENPHPEEIVSALRKVAACNANLVTAAASSQDDLARAAKANENAIHNLLKEVAGALTLTDDPVVKEKLKETIKAVTSANAELTEKVISANSKKGTHTEEISSASEIVRDKFAEVMAAVKTLPGGEEVKLEEESADDLEDLAEKELINAAREIEAAAKTLFNIKKKEIEPGVEATFATASDEISGAILGASKAITVATAKLVRAAVVTQGNRKGSKKTGAYRADPEWSDGLVSAAKHVVAMTSGLVVAANKTVEETDGSELDEIVVIARAVATSTSRLVQASRLKASTNDPSLAQLSSAAKAVASATAELVNAAQHAAKIKAEEKAEEETVVNFNATGSKVSAFENQMEIYRLEQELKAAQEKMRQSNKKNYQN